jgi:hypothetical protein
MRVSRNKVDFVTLSSSGFPAVSELPSGSTLHFIDTGEQYVAYNGTWEPDLRLARALETAHKI